MMEELLNPDEIKLILNEAKKLIYKDPKVLNLESNKTSIFKVSANSGLILIHGNEFTGWKHIDMRHSSASKKAFWMNEYKIDNPSKFSLELPPINYLRILDQIYKPENLNLEKNKDPELFDLYSGYAKLDNIPETKYNLVLYKGTKVVHTFFVSDNKKPFNKNKILNLSQRFTSATMHLCTGIELYNIPYFDYKNIEKFRIVLLVNKFKGFENWYIQMNNDFGEPILTSLIRSDKVINELPVPFRASQLDYTNLTWLEKEIKKMIDGKFQF